MPTAIVRSTPTVDKTRSIRHHAIRLTTRHPPITIPPTLTEAAPITTTPAQADRVAAVSAVAMAAVTARADVAAPADADVIDPLRQKIRD